MFPFDEMMTPFVKLLSPSVVLAWPFVKLPALRGVLAERFDAILTATVSASQWYS
jgi:hypothetical protein